MATGVLLTLSELAAFVLASTKPEGFPWSGDYVMAAAMAALAGVVLGLGMWRAFRSTIAAGPWQFVAAAAGTAAAINIVVARAFYLYLSLSASIELLEWALVYSGITIGPALGCACLVGVNTRSWDVSARCVLGSVVLACVVGFARGLNQVAQVWLPAGQRAGASYLFIMVAVSVLYCAALYTLFWLALRKRQPIDALGGASAEVEAHRVRPEEQ
jgi:hypothetical protein